MNTASFHLRTLRAELERRMARRTGYSLRAFARSLDLEPGSLVGILSDRRRIPKAKIDSVIAKLALSPAEASLFRKSNAAKETDQRGPIISAPIKRHELDLDRHFKIISEWEHYAILSLISTSDFKADPKWIAERLGITVTRAQICLDHLSESDLIQMNDGKLVANHAAVTTKTDIPSEALKKARRQDLDQAALALEEIAVEIRDFGACTMTVAPSDLSELKRMIREFRRFFMATAESNPGKEVYKLAIQFFPLTKRLK